MTPHSKIKRTTKRDQFLEESLKLIHEKGFKAMTMRDIADRMNFEPANIYKFIDSKQSLLEILIFSISDEFHRRIDQILASSYSSVEKLKAVVSLHVQLTSTRPYEVAVLVNEWRNLDVANIKKIADRRVEYQEKLKSILTEGSETGFVREMDVDITVNSIMAIFSWLYNWYIDHADEVNPIELEKQIFDFIYLGVSPN